jgi:hypothetical protein
MLSTAATTSASSANCHRNIGPQDDVMVLPAWFVPDNHAPMAMISTMREGSFSVV